MLYEEIHQFLDWWFPFDLKDLLDSKETNRAEWYKRMWLVGGREKAGLIKTTEKEHCIAEYKLCPTEQFCCNLKD